MARSWRRWSWAVEVARDTRQQAARGAGRLRLTVGGDVAGGWDVLRPTARWEVNVQQRCCSLVHRRGRRFGRQHLRYGRRGLAGGGDDYLRTEAMAGTTMGVAAGAAGSRCTTRATVSRERWRPRAVPATSGAVPGTIFMKSSPDSGATVRIDNAGHAGARTPPPDGTYEFERVEVRGNAVLDLSAKDVLRLVS